MVSTGFASGGRSDDRTVHRTLAVGRYMLDMGYRSMVLANVASIIIYRPPRVTVGKLFFVLFAIIFGGVAGALYLVSPVTIAIGMAVGLVIGFIPFIPSPPISLMITGCDGGAAIFESSDLKFLQRVKSFLDARINQDDLAMTGFFDFANSRFAPLRNEGSYEPPQQDDAFELNLDEEEPAPPPPPRARREEPVRRPEPAPRAPTPPPPPRKAPEPAEETVGPIDYDDGFGLDDLDLSADNIRSRPAPAAPAAPKAPEPKPAAPKERDLHDTTASGVRDAHFEDLGRSEEARASDIPAADGEPDPRAETLSPIDFSRVMPQLAHVRRFYDETLQDADAVDQLDTMIVLMEEGAVSKHSRQRILEIASTMQEQVETYPSIASIFAGIASRVRI
ncbi:hypothetical protein ACKTEK_10545 [Tepidamorphus sp. 3E244]|uniref:hypothetical protein n=1 Tax=Tepidamorphus sp. 3E244 TaxID=3385498 RepID=UPI0038FCBC87